MNARRILVLVALVGLLATTASGQESSLQAAKDLYASAAYEDALSVLARLQRADAPPEVQQYRAFCLIALGRLREAEQAIESVVAANPQYAPTAMDVSPRIQEAFARTRKQLLPEIARQLYGDAKRALDKKDRDAAIAGFGAVVALIDGADPEVRESMDELRFLSAGFLDLSRALRVPQADSATEAPAVGSHSGSRAHRLRPTRPSTLRLQSPFARSCRHGSLPMRPADRPSSSGRFASVSPPAGVWRRPR